MLRSSIKLFTFAILLGCLGCKQGKDKVSTESQSEVSILIEHENFKSKKNIDSLLNKKYKSGQLNGNILVVKNDDVVYENSFGYADASRNIKLTEEYRFNIGSVYKEFPAVAIMQLVEQGELNVSDKLSKYVKGLPQWADSISIKSLLQYSSGLPKMRWDEHFSKGITVTEEIIMDDLKNVKCLAFTPETEYLYSNYSPLLLTKVIERITMQDFQSYAQKNLFDPYGLNQSKINGQYPYKNKALMAIPFNENFVVDKYKTTVPLVLYSSTTRDMYKWFKKLGDFEIINEQSVKFLSQEAITGNNIQAPLGRCDWEDGKIIEHSHHGSSASYECVVRRFKPKGISIIILTNQKHRNVYKISEEILDILENNKA